METNGCYSMFLLWALCILACAVCLFTGGFLRTRTELTEKSGCHNYSSPYPDSCNIVPRQYGKAIILIIDALKYDFTLYNDSVPLELARPYQNRLPVLRHLTKNNGRLYEFLADPPTTTMQRLKGLTTGSLPTFIDVSSNFASSEIHEDNIIDQLIQRGKRVVFAGDDTWMGLFPGRFDRAYPYPSFDVWDLDTVDTGVTKHLYHELQRPDQWDVFIGHYLGVDHVGHKFGPNHPEMTRKLTEMNTVLEHVTSTLPKDCVLFVMGDHGMTVTGDHGGDSHDEISAALFIYGNKDRSQNSSLDVHLNTRNQTPPSAINQVDFVPTFCLLLDLPIPFSNLGKVIYDVVVPAAVKQVQYLRVNVEQVFHYLETYNSYSYISGGNQLPKSIFSSIENMIKEFREKRNTALNGSDVKTMLDLGNQLLSKAKAMCQSTFIEFDLYLMWCGLCLIFLDICILLVLTWIPEKSFLRNIIDLPCLVTLLGSAIFGAGLGAFTLLVSSKSLQDENNGTSKENAGMLFVMALAGFISLVVFCLMLLWRIRHSIHINIFDIWNSLKADKINLLHYGLCIILFCSVFTNSYVVEEASVTNFCVLTSLISLLFSVRSGEKKGVLILAILISMGSTITTNVYFRCREEQQNYCTSTDFHKPLANLPADTSKTYTNWRFFFTILSVFLTVLLPHQWLTKTGNLNGASIPVSMAKIVPIASGIFLVCNWALQAKNVFSLPLESAGTNYWQHHLLAQIVLSISLVTLVSLVINPKLIYKKIEKAGPPTTRQLFRPRNGGVQDYWNYMRTNWKQEFTVPSNLQRQQQILLYGIGTSLSAPIISIATNFSIMTMLVLGDGLCPAMFLLMMSSTLFLFVTSISRIRKLSAKSTMADLLQVQWSDIIGWHLLEGLFFYGTGHQPTFPTIQWGAAFIGGFSGADYGSNATNPIFGYILPAVFIGWNTYISRIWFGLFLPMLLVAPFAIWMGFQSLRPKSLDSRQVLTELTRPDFESNDTCSTSNQDSSWGPNTNLIKELERGEVYFLENTDHTRSQVFILCIRYCILQSVRVFSTMLASAYHSRHLMVWKIFAPRFIFEGIGCVVSFVSVTFGYLLFVRIQNSVSRYYQNVQSYDKDK